jgi:GMP synthase-like glutamine amidotransferase
MRLHVIKHVEFEGPGLIAEWAAANGHELTESLASTQVYPLCDDVDLLVIMGGPMDADDEVASPWLHAEKHFVVECIAAGHAVLGVCLGAQILAEVLGGKVKRSHNKEIGWHVIEKTIVGRVEPLVAGWPDAVVVGQWHGDTFDLPAGLEPLFSSEACANQAFVFDNRVVGLQFHLEWTEEVLTRLMQECRSELVDGEMWVMSASEIRDEMPDRIDASRDLLFSLLDAITADIRSPVGDPAL